MVDDKIVGCALSIIVDYDMVMGDHTYAKVTGNETFRYSYIRRAKRKPR